MSLISGVSVVDTHSLLGCCSISTGTRKTEPLLSSQGQSCPQGTLDMCGDPLGCHRVSSWQLIGTSWGSSQLSCFMSNYPTLPSLSSVLTPTTNSPAVEAPGLHSSPPYFP